MEARVVMSGLILNLATMARLTAPARAPDASPAAIRRTALPVWSITTVAIPPAQASTEPTDRSKLPDARQNSMVHDTIPTVDTASNSPPMFTAEAKFLTNNEQPTSRAASTSNMPARSQKEIRREEEAEAEAEIFGFMSWNGHAA